MSMLKVNSSISTKLTLASQYNPQFADATNELGTVHKISFFKFKDKQDKCNPAVALEIARQYLLFYFF